MPQHTQLAVEEYLAIPPVYGTLGLPLGSNQYRFDPPGRPGYIYYIRNGATLDIALDGGIARVGGLPIKVELDDQGRKVIRAGGFDPVKIMQFMGTNPGAVSVVGRHNHGVLFGNVDWVEGKRLEPGRVRFTDAANLSVRIWPFYYIYEGVQKFFPGALIDLTTPVDYLPTTTDEWWWIKVGVDRLTNLPVVLTGTSDADKSTLTEDNLAAIALAGILPLGGLRVQNGQTTPGLETDVIDCRPWLTGDLSVLNFTPSSSADTAGVAGDVARDSDYFYVKDEINGWMRAALSTF